MWANKCKQNTCCSTCCFCGCKSCAGCFKCISAWEYHYFSLESSLFPTLLHTTKKTFWSNTLNYTSIVGHHGWLIRQSFTRILHEKQQSSTRIMSSLVNTFPKKLHYGHPLVMFHSCYSPKLLVFGYQPTTINRHW